SRPMFPSAAIRSRAVPAFWQPLARKEMKSQALSPLVREKPAVMAGLYLHPSPLSLQPEGKHGKKNQKADFR
ncbi:MAG: hypothetical protein ABI700_15340, partial [Chloroflexota bacterium]